MSIFIDNGNKGENIIFFKFSFIGCNSYILCENSLRHFSFPRSDLAQACHSFYNKPSRQAVVGEGLWPLHMEIVVESKACQ